MDSTPSSTASQTDRVQAQITLVEEGLVFEGTVRAEEDVRAHGHIIGTLEVDGKVMIAEEGVVEGDIIATDAEIGGQVQGDIRVKKTLVLKSTARVDGEIEADRLVIGKGAQFTGTCKVDTPIPVSACTAGGEKRQHGEVRQDDNEATEPELPEEVAVPKQKRPPRRNRDGQ